MTTVLDKPAAMGRRLPRLDGQVKSTGAAKYTMDIDLPGMLHCKILRSPVAHARIRRIDTTRAEALPGVGAVLTYQNVPHVAFNGSLRTPADKNILPLDEGILEDRVRFIGDKVAAVAATSEAIAEEALKLIEVEYEELPAVFDPVAALAPGAPLLHDGYEQNIASRIDRPLGDDVEAAFAQADRIFETQVAVQRQQHATIEPHCCVCDWDLRGKLTVWSSTQVPFAVRSQLGTILKLPLSKIQVLTAIVGGAFGGKDELFEEPLVALLSQRTGKPVKLVLDRQEEFVSTRVRHPIRFDLKLGVNEDGEIIAGHLRATMDAGPYSVASPKIMRAMGLRWSTMYRIPAARYEARCVYTNTPVSGAFRGYGNPQMNFTMETALDHIAEQMGIDPIEFHLKNYAPVGYRSPWTGLPLNSSALEECLRKAAERIGWYEWRERKRRGQVPSTGPKRYGLGFAAAMHATSSFPAAPEVSSAVIQINEDGTATVMTGAAELGQGAETAMTQIAAETLGVRAEDVDLVGGDTDRVPFDYGAYGSRTTHLAGNAVAAAALDARQQIFEEAAKLLEADPADLEARDRQIYVKGAPDRSVSFVEVIQAALYQNRKVIIGRGSYALDCTIPPYGCQFAEVEVDVETGQVRVLRVVAANDVGIAVNPLLIEGQMDGAIYQGVGYALTENLVVDPTTGRALNPNFTDYRVLLAPDMPKIETIIVEAPDPTGHYPLKGVGEMGLVPTASAVANAIYDAIGVRFWELPMTPERVLAALERQARA